MNRAETAISQINSETFERIADSCTPEILASYIADQTGERVFSGNGTTVLFAVGTKAGSIKVRESEGKAVATDFAGGYLDGKQGDLLDWIRALERLDMTAAINRAKEILGLPMTELQSYTPYVTPKPANTDRQPRGLLLTDEHKALLRKGLQTPEFAQILAQRGITGLDVARLQNIGFWPSNATYKGNQYIDLFEGVKSEIVKGERTGNKIIAVTVRAKPRSIVVWNDCGGVKQIPLDGRGRRYKGEDRFHNIQPSPAFHDAAFLPAELATDNTEIWLVEGEFDALALNSLGFYTRALPPEKDWQTILDTYFAKGMTVYLCYDADKAGMDKTDKVLKSYPLAIDASGFVRDMNRRNPAWNDVADFVQSTYLKHDGDSRAARLEAIETISRCAKSARMTAAAERDKRVALSDITGNWKQDKSGEFKAKLSYIIDALACKDFCNGELAYDVFQNKPVWRWIGGDWEVLDESTAAEIVAHLERAGFASISMNTFNSAKLATLKHAPEINTFAEQLEKDLPVWDGVERIRRFFPEYIHAKENPEYLERAAYMLFTSMYGRATHLNPDGLKCDNTIVLVGKQGQGKSKLVPILARGKRFTGEIDFNKSIENIYRSMEGKAILEAPELKGLSTKSVDDIKAFMTAQKDEWVPKYKEFLKGVARHSIIIMTTNDTNFLRDSTGNRRFVPIRVDGAAIEIEAIERDLDQLWAEARYLYEQNGIMWQGMESAAKQYLADYETHDPWYDIIDAKLRNVTRITVDIIEAKILGLEIRQTTPKEMRRVVDCLRFMGFERKTVRITADKLDTFGGYARLMADRVGDTVKIWERTAPTDEPDVSDVFPIEPATAKQPDYPAEPADYPAKQPDYPAKQPDYPAKQPDYPAKPAETRASYSPYSVWPKPRYADEMEDLDI